VVRAIAISVIVGVFITINFMIGKILIQELVVLIKRRKQH